MAPNTKNFVTEVACRANVPLGNTCGTLTKPGSIADYANNAAGNFDSITQIGMHAMAMAENNQPSNVGGGPAAGGSSGMRSMVGAAAMIGIGAAVPGAAPFMAAAGVAMAIKDAVKFSVGHAAVDGAQGELTMAAAAATFDKSGEMTSYTAACDNVTTDAKSGKSLAAVAVGPSANAPLKGIHNLQGIIGEVSEQYDPKKIQEDIKAMLDKEKKNFGWAMNKLDMMGVLDPSSDKTLELSQEAKVALKMDTQRPKAVMAPAAFGMA